MKADLINPPDVTAIYLEDDGRIPNSALPLLLYRGAVRIPENDPAATFERMFEDNGWSGCWRDGVYPYHHYHSNTHEVLGVFAGTAEIQFGGDSGERLAVRAGDVAAIPAGVAHKKLNSSDDFGVVGSYPEGMSHDMKYGKPEERPRADENIKEVPLPQRDPVYGTEYGVREHWIAKSSGTREPIG